MAENSDEGIESGLGWIKGSVKKFNIEKIKSNQKFLTWDGILL